MPEIDFAKIVAEDAAANPVAPLAPQVVSGDAPPALTEETADTVAAPGEEAPAPTEAELAEKAKQAEIDKRFAKVTAKRREAERRAEQLEARLAAIEARGAAKPNTDDPLDPSKFASTEERDAAIKAEALKEARAEAAAEAHNRKMSEFRERLEKDGKDIDDFDDTMETLFSKEFKVSGAAAKYLVERAENPALLAKWLTDNKDEAKGIFALDAVDAAIELKRRDGLLGRKATPPVSRAPAPTPSVSGSGTAPQSIDRMPLGEVEKMVRQWNRK